MKSASDILFKEKFGSGVLFKNQQDLVNQLLTHRESPYYLESLDRLNYERAQSRLKTYISQLLSVNATRSITEDLRKGIEILLTKKLKNNIQVAELLELIIKDLKNKNSIPVKSIAKQDLTEQFLSDLHSGQYISVITARPLESEQSNINEFSLSHAILKDIIDSLVNPSKEFKYYRLNFPLRSSGVLFWNGLLLLIERYLKKNYYKKEIFEALYQKFTLKTTTLDQLLKSSQLDNDDLRKVVNEILHLLNRNRMIMVFIVEVPIYTMPTIAIDPGDAANMKLYSILDDSNNRSMVFKFSMQDLTLWRLFVWDKLQSKQFKGEALNFSPEILFV